MELKPIQEIAKSLQIQESQMDLYGKYKAKLDLSLIDDNPKGNLVLISAVSPTPAGEGKTTTNVGLSMALNKLGFKAISALREPSLGPNFGMKGGATGGGKAQVLPMDDINLHFTGDLHAITSANNLLSAIIDNHIWHGNALNIDPNNIVWRRAVDMNDRALRNITINQDDKKAPEHKESFDITVASEVMAVFCLASDLKDLETRLGNMLVAYSLDGTPIHAKDLEVVGAMMALLKDAFKPNLVQTTEYTPAIIHGGPFANIAHGCNSVVATKMALSISDYVLTEAGFGSDLGAEKFMNIKTRQAGLTPKLAVLVATIRSLKYQGGIKVRELNEENIEAMIAGFPNLKRHIDGLSSFGMPVLVALNRFPTDTDQEIEALTTHLAQHGIELVVSEVFSKGGEGALELGRKVVEYCAKDSTIVRTYHDDDSILDKLTKIVQTIYGGRNVVLSERASKQLESIQKNYGTLQVCVAKTQYSFTDDAKALCAPTDFDITIKEFRVSEGAGFIVALSGTIMTMPGLPKDPHARYIGLEDDGSIFGIKG
ncbi:formate--tetrahydrofolate ligase [Erysipelothrix larvae]|uniref:Formate--tetrahydrofolate ligase n=1 Tax=Erysipelothrix larvae TaxID=1514105 RepID=A0A0X8H1D6_9FIRM|nr:formate--tetrahydrofolate ligase [Erysipelothrix larvae]AMC94317.1 formate--tetrahydrofolate ligase [Erysipelothrix larvae]